MPEVMLGQSDIAALATIEILLVIKTKLLWREYKPLQLLLKVMKTNLFLTPLPTVPCPDSSAIIATIHVIALLILVFAQVAGLAVQNATRGSVECI
jgi:hypothetical protein